jgi:hypothetical protein
VIRVQDGNWASDHDANNEVGFALLYRVNGQFRFVRALIPGQQPVRYEYGTWAPGGFTVAGTTSGTLVPGAGGTATIDIPAQAGAVAGTVLANPFVLTWDDAPAPYPAHWVDRGPGGTTPDGTEYGADYVVGSCGASGGGPGGPGPGPGGLSSVKLSAPSKRVGAGRVTVRGSVTPARSGVPVEVTAKGRRSLTRGVTTAADGTFSARLRLTETTAVRAAAGGLGSPTLTIKMFSRTRIKVKRLRGGGVLVSGRVSPALPGRVLLLRTTAVRPSARTTARKGRFRFRLRHARRGRYEAVFIPSRGRAERSTSNKGVIK